MDAAREWHDGQRPTESESESEKSMGEACCADLEENGVICRAKGRLGEWVEPSSCERLCFRVPRLRCGSGYQ